MSKIVQGLKQLLIELSSPATETPAPAHAVPASPPCVQPDSNKVNTAQSLQGESPTISLDDFMFGEEGTEMDLN